MDRRKLQRMILCLVVLLLTQKAQDGQTAVLADDVLHIAHGSILHVPAEQQVHLPLHAFHDSFLHETPERSLREIRRSGEPTFPRDLAPRRFSDTERAEDARPAVKARQFLVEEQTIAVKPPPAAATRDPLRSTSPRESTGSLAAGEASRSISSLFTTSTPSTVPRGGSAR